MFHVGLVSLWLSHNNKLEVVCDQKCNHVFSLVNLHASISKFLHKLALVNFPTVISYYSAFQLHCCHLAWWQLLEGFMSPLWTSKYLTLLLWELAWWQPKGSSLCQFYESGEYGGLAGKVSLAPLPGRSSCSMALQWLDGREALRCWGIQKLHGPRFGSSLGLTACKGLSGQWSLGLVFRELLAESPVWPNQDAGKNRQVCLRMKSSTIYQPLISRS